MGVDAEGVTTGVIIRVVLAFFLTLLCWLFYHMGYVAAVQDALMLDCEEIERLVN